MSMRIPPVGTHARCIRAAIDGLESADECRLLSVQVAGFVAAAGGLVIDHVFIRGEIDFGLRLWASREDLVTFAAGMRASLRCLVDRPGQRESGLPNRTSPRVEVNVALAPPSDPLSPLILDALAGMIDPEQLARIARVLATDPGKLLDPADDELFDHAHRLLALRPGWVLPSVHLDHLVRKLGLAHALQPVRPESLTDHRRES